MLLGLIHISQLAGRRVEDVRDVINEDEPVFVKVIDVVWVPFPC